MRYASFLAYALIVALVGTACSRNDDSSPVQSDGVRVASFDFAESELIAELYSQMLERASIPVRRLGPVGPREVVAPALELGRIDVVPEYLGTALQYFGGPTEPQSDAAESEATLSELLTRRGLELLEPAPAQNTNIVVVTDTTAAELRLAAISDLLHHASDLRFGGPVECPDRPLCLVGLANRYGLEFGEFVPQRSLEVTAEALRRGEIDVGLMFSTAAEFDDDFAVLDDDRRLQPAENVVPLVRKPALDRWGSGISVTLNRLSRTLTTDGLRELNRDVANGRPIETVAADWIEANIDTS